MDKEANNSRNRNDMRKPDGRRNHYTRRNTMKWNKRTESIQRTGKERQTIIGGKQNHLCRQKNLHAK